MMWVWILSLTVLGSNPDHVKIAKYETKRECQQALILKIQEYKMRNKEIVGHCYYGNQSTGWW